MSRQSVSECCQVTSDKIPEHTEMFFIFFPSQFIFDQSLMYAYYCAGIAAHHGFCFPKYIG